MKRPTKEKRDPEADKLINEALMALFKLSNHFKETDKKRMYDTNKAIKIVWRNYDHR